MEGENSCGARHSFGDYLAHYAIVVPVTFFWGGMVLWFCWPCIRVLLTIWLFLVTPHASDDGEDPVPPPERLVQDPRYRLVRLHSEH